MVIFAMDRWTHRVHISGEDATRAGRWSFFTMLVKYNKLLFMSHYRLCLHPPQSCLGSAYFQRSRIVEDTVESIPFPIDPHLQTICDLQIFIAIYEQEGYLVFLLVDGHQDDIHVFREQEYDGKFCTPLGFHYDKSIDVYIASMVDSCELVNIHKHTHTNTSQTQSSGSTQIDFIFVSAPAAEYIDHCGILDNNTIFSSDDIPLFIDIDILCILGYTGHEKIRALERNLKLNGPRLIDAYQATLIQQLLNKNMRPRVFPLYGVGPLAWAMCYELCNT
jgi:hypothetical protein